MSIQENQQNNSSTKNHGGHMGHKSTLALSVFILLAFVAGIAIVSMNKSDHSDDPASTEISGVISVIDEENYGDERLINLKTDLQAEFEDDLTLPSFIVDAGDVYMEYSDYDRAVKLYTESLNNLGSYSKSVVLERIAKAYRANGETQKAIDTYGLLIEEIQAMQPDRARAIRLEIDQVLKPELNPSEQIYNEELYEQTKNSGDDGNVQ